MMNLSSDVIRLLRGKTLVTAESLTGGSIGGALTSVSGASEVYKGGIVSYTNEVKNRILGVDQNLLNTVGAVSAPVAEAMASGARKVLNADIAVSATGLAGPGGDEFGNPVGTVYIGYSDDRVTLSREFHFSGNRDEVRRQSVEAALNIILENNG